MSCQEESKIKYGPARINLIIVVSFFKLAHNGRV